MSQPVADRAESRSFRPKPTQSDPHVDVEGIEPSSGESNLRSSTSVGRLRLDSDPRWRIDQTSRGCCDQFASARTRVLSVWRGFPGTRTPPGSPLSLLTQLEPEPERSRTLPDPRDHLQRSCQLVGCVPFHESAQLGSLLLYPHPLRRNLSRPCTRRYGIDARTVRIVALPGVLVVALQREAVDERRSRTLPAMEPGYGYRAFSMA
jgi:hypothetical protein